MKFKSDIEVQAGLKDSSGSIGASGQVLSSTGSNVSWINQTTIANDVQNLVKAGVAITKGQAVYVTGADGTNIIVGLASNTSEATSSKTLGLLNATVAINGMADVVQIGRLSGLNTIGATAGDPVWLGTNGNLIYGLINKPYAPAHLVFLGIVTRVNANNGEIFVNVQNGFELKEIHDVDIITNVPINGDVLGYDGTLWVNKTIAEWLGYTPANASGTTNYVSKFTGANTLGNSLLFDNGTNVGIGTTSPQYTLDVNGTSRSTTFRVDDATNSTGLLIYSGAPSGGGAIARLLKADSTKQVYQTFENDSLYLGIAANQTSVADIGTKGGVNLVFSTSYAERMRITSGGNVGIGTSAPNSLLSVAGNATFGQGANRPVTYDSNGGNFRITPNSGGWATGYLFNGSAGTFKGGFGGFGSGDTLSYLWIGDDYNIPTITVMPNQGNVGIGTTSPSLGKLVSKDSGYQFIAEPTDTATYGYLGIGQFTNGAFIGTTAGSNSASDILRLGTSGTERMRITSGGNVGIGTTSPSTLLQVKGNGNNMISLQYASDGGAAGYGFYNSSGTELWSIGGGRFVAQDALEFSRQGSLKMLITSSGNVGIGTTSPSGKFEIDASGSFNWGFPSTAVAKIGTKGTGGSLLVSTPSLNSSYESGFAVDGTYSSGKSVINLTAFGVLSGGSYGADIAFRTTSQSALSEKMRITSDGNVGIGTTAPQAKLHINNGTDRNLWFRVNGNGTGTELLSINDAQSTRQSLAFSASSFYFDSGNVGIGTSSPLDKLDVFGNQFLGDGTNTSQLYLRGVAGVSYAWTVKNLGTGYQVKSTSPGAGDGFNIDFSNRVGIGTTSPNSLLQVGSSNFVITDRTSAVYGPESQTIFTVGRSGVDYPQLLNFGVNQAGLYSSISARQFTVATENNLALQPNGGNVGIGTTSPGVKFVNAGAPLADNPTLGSGTIGSQALISANGLYGMYSGVSSSGDVWHQVQRNDGNTTAYNLLLQPSGGNVGIGTINTSSYPFGEKLNVAGNITINGTKIGFGTTDSFVAYGWYSAAHYGISWAGNNPLALSGYYGLGFFTLGSEKMRIDTSGNVGIGTSSPSSNLTVVRNANNASYITTFSNTNAGASAATISEWKVNGYSSFVIGKSNSDGRVEIAQIGNNNIDFINNGTNVMSIDTNQNVMVNGTTAEACAQLEIKSETKGFLPPRMSDADRDNISSPVEGLMIYNTTQRTINFYDGTTWQRVAVV